MIRKQFKRLFVFDATTTSNQEPPTCLPNGSKSNWPTKNGADQKRAECNEHISWPQLAFGHCPSTSPIDGSPKTDCSNRSPSVAAVAASWLHGCIISPAKVTVDR
ncbi:uncharacterized protein LOC108093521 [Drosophila ficusphila]|uniref:uncharacterized protein LOC108093521 n=1 Tax=Drosophila ficusphila TaxID=30025 RepID=UPI0007E6547E|nr:uncharacterized protein LOC108093521 [Drosophila ficusphila]